MARRRSKIHPDKYTSIAFLRCKLFKVADARSSKSSSSFSRLQGFLVYFIPGVHEKIIFEMINKMCLNLSALKCPMSSKCSEEIDIGRQTCNLKQKSTIFFFSIKRIATIFLRMITKSSTASLHASPSK